MKIYEFENATFYVDGEIDKELLRKATIKLVRDIRKYKIDQEERKGCQQQ
jgi:hypothetical protein|nr:MAG TPA: hypothetical protein [Caudoviricetes sp.]